jgi:hypothetical protein
VLSRRGRAVLAYHDRPETVAALLDRGARLALDAGTAVFFDLPAMVALLREPG